jgi:hypothetical protein
MAAIIRGLNPTDDIKAGDTIWTKSNVPNSQKEMGAAGFFLKEDKKLL